MEDADFHYAICLIVHEHNVEYVFILTLNCYVGATIPILWCFTSLVIVYCI